MATVWVFGAIVFVGLAVWTGAPQVRSLRKEMRSIREKRAGNPGPSDATKRPPVGLLSPWELWSRTEISYRVQRESPAWVRRATLEVIDWIFDRTDVADHRLVEGRAALAEGKYGQTRERAAVDEFARELDGGRGLRIVRKAEYPASLDLTALRAADALWRALSSDPADAAIGASYLVQSVSEPEAVENLMLESFRMTALETWLSPPDSLLLDEPSSVRRIGGETVPKLSEHYARSGAIVVEVDGSHVLGKDSFFGALRAVLPFPKWAEDDWDALDGIHEELSGEWPFPSVLVVTNFSDLENRDGKLADAIVTQMVGLSAGFETEGEQFEVYFAS